MNQLDPAIREVLLEAVSEVLKDTEFDLNSRWKDLTENLKEKIYAQAIKKLLGSDETTVAQALLIALQDDEIKSKEWRDILTAWANAHVGQDEVAQDLIVVLNDAKITTVEAVRVGVKWAKRQVNDRTVQALLDGISATGFDEAAAWDALKVFLKNAGIPTDISDGLINAVEVDRKIGKKELFQLLAAFAATAKQEELVQFINRLQNEPPQTVVIAFLNSRLPQEVNGLLEKIIALDWPALISFILGLAKIELGAEVIGKLLEGKVQNFVVKLMTDFLAKQGVGHAGDVASTIVDLVTGARSLFATGPEPDAPALTSPARIVLWQEIRETIYLCQLFLNEGSVVSTDPMAPPHVFQSAKIRFGTPAHKLVGAKNDEAHRK
ncbi:hypothetical protein LC612_42820, partial [Nostoc sp. CHAB 5834]|nr:hypothetical protein [Nostoc sp. CHAB 5834]